MELAAGNEIGIYLAHQELHKQDVCSYVCMYVCPVALHMYV